MESEKACYFIVTPDPQTSSGFAIMKNGQERKYYSIKFGDGPGERYPGTTPGFHQGVNTTMRLGKVFESGLLKGRYGQERKGEWYIAWNNPGTNLQQQLAKGVSYFSKIDFNFDKAKVEAAEKLGITDPLSMKIVPEVYSQLASLMAQYLPANTEQAA